MQVVGVVLLVDDVYGVGVVGDEGCGSCVVQVVCFELLVVIFGKVFGVSGVVVLCDEVMVDYLLQFVCYLIYSIVMLFVQVVVLSVVLGIICSDEGWQCCDILVVCICQFCEGMGKVLLGLIDFVSVIQLLIVGDNVWVLNLVCCLCDVGCWVMVICLLMVLVGSVCLCLILIVVYYVEDINCLLEVLYGYSE